MIKIYHKTATINAEQFDGSDGMVDKYDIEVVEGDYADDYSMPEAGPAPYFRYFMPSGYNEIYAGDWVATGINGEHWAISDDVFKKTHAELPVIPKIFADTIEELKANHYELSEFFNEWKCDYDEQELIARAWLDGYTVEEE